MTASTTVRARVDVPATAAARSIPNAGASIAKQIPFRGPELRRGVESAQWSGALPAWLRGDLVRVAPSFGATPGWSPGHWFDALGLVFGFKLGGEPRVALRWSTLDCEMGAAAMRGRVPFAQFSSPNERGLLARLFQPVPSQTDNTNVNVVRMGKELVALTETSHQLRLDATTLETRGRVKYDDALAGCAMLAHPIIYADTLTNLATRFGRQASVTLYDQQGGSRKRRVRAAWQSAELPYIHSFGLTERHGIIVDHPLRVRPSEMLWSNRSLIDKCKWTPATGTRLVLLDLNGGDAHTHETEAFFCFHTVHAFETADATVLDLLAYEDASIVGALSLSRLSAGLPSVHAKLLRLSVDRRSGKVTRRPLSDTKFEFPQVDWDFVGASEQQFVYGASIDHDATGLHSQVTRVDVSSGAVSRFAEADYIFGEPVFVGEPGRLKEGQGVLLTVGSSERGAALFVLDASTLDVIAHAEFSSPLPLGFHGSFVSV